MRRRVSIKQTYKTPQELREAINAYFDEADESKSPYTISGLCLQIGFSKDMLMKQSTSTEFGEVLQQARLLIEQQHEIRLLTTKKPTGTIFALKNLGWSDRSFLDVGINGGQSDNPEGLKWTVEVIAPGESRNKRGKDLKLKGALDQPKYDPPALSETPELPELSELEPALLELKSANPEPAPVMTKFDPKTLTPAIMEMFS